MIHLKSHFLVDSITKYNAEPVNIYPGGDVLPGVGVATTGRYVTKEKHLHGYFNFNRVNTSVDKNGKVVGLGQMYFSLRNKDRHCYRDIKFYVQYNVKTQDPLNAFSVVALEGFITKAKVDGKPYFGNIHFKPVEGGKKYKVYLELEPLEQDYSSNHEEEEQIVPN